MTEEKNIMTDPLIQITTQLTRVVVSIIMVIGIDGNLLNIAVLTRPTLYNNSCSRYLLALACNCLFVTSMMLTYRLLADGYQLDVTKVSLFWCKLVNYLFQACLALSAYFIVFASIDRCCASSTNVRIRNFNNIKVTRWAIPFIVIIIMLFYINTAILIDLRLTDTFGCRIRGDTIYKQVYPAIHVLLVTIIAPGLMTFFGIMTIRNARRLCVIPTIVSRDRRTENQLACMLLFQVSIYVVLILPTAVAYLIVAKPNPVQSTPAFYLARMITQFSMYLFFATPFFLYVISARTYRDELVDLLYKIVPWHRMNQVRPYTITTTKNIVAPNATANQLP